ncbi:ArsR/SmtB family transcription factor [Amycolatopsis jiangsuensis]|uniref:DNA-binding transcriptional ArsR family regulator n=1 Tax=Amycolatopsis jiangsuensis TaxID=1181879 RepID=A0A840IPN7_9PSEU|nr:helix-turn-helix domain-containing protein [Amycolatopsis jiangsuensis]MBB4684346.1 DNA-binding transcriptional ArsR family regulator [Amycolatopsis jiangsuensis]
MRDVEVIEDPATAAIALEPVRARLLAALTEPASAAALAGRVGLTRQKVNYHLRALEAHGLVEPAGTRQWGGLTERLFAATAASYLVSPAALGAAGKSAVKPDRLSVGYLLAVAGRTVREVAGLARRAARAGKPLSTLTLDTEISFRSARERAAFTEELTTVVTALVSRYHDESSPDARMHRLVVVAHPKPAE